MNNPALAGDYDYWPTRYTGTSDNGGVHWNSGIANLAFYLMVSGGTHPQGKTSNSVPALNANAVTRLLKPKKTAPQKAAHRAEPRGMKRAITPIPPPKGPIPNCGQKRNESAAFVVWAPFLKQVELKIVSPQERIIALKKDKAGYWKMPVTEVSPDTL